MIFFGWTIQTNQKGERMVGWYRRWGRWVWIGGVLLIISLVIFIKNTRDWMSVILVVVAVLSVLLAAAVSIRDGRSSHKDERLRQVRLKSMAVGFWIMLSTAIFAQAFSVPHGLFFTLIAGVLSFLASNLYLRNFG